MKARPIIFNSEMIHALLEGRKTQARRVIKLPELPINQAEWNATKYQKILDIKNCPYGQPGDLLWVREKWAHRYTKPIHCDSRDVVFTDDNQASSVIAWKPSIHMPRWASRITLRITDVRVERLQDISLDDCVSEGVRIPASKNSVLIQLTGKFPACKYLPKGWINNMDEHALIRAYHASLWDSIFYKKYPWESNPWVWVIEFEIIKKNVDEI